jgi:hypothetical protein
MPLDGILHRVTKAGNETRSFPMRTKLGAFTLIAAMSCGAAFAQNPFAGQTPVKVELKKSFSSRDAKIGAEITAQTYQDLVLGTTKIPKGSTLAGHIVDVTKHSKDTPNGSVTIVFDQARPKKGDPVAITASVYKLLPPDDSGQRADAPGMRGGSENSAATAMRPAADANSKVVNGMVSASSAPIQVVSYLPGIALSAVASDTKSGIVVAKNDDVTLLAGIYMIVGIAPAAK